MNGSYVIGRRRAGRREENAAPEVRIDPEAGLTGDGAALISLSVLPADLICKLILRKRRKTLIKRKKTRPAA